MDQCYSMKRFSGFIEYQKIAEVYILEKIERIVKGKEGAEELKDLVNAIRDGDVDDDENDPVFQTIRSRFPLNLSTVERDRFAED